MLSKNKIKYIHSLEQKKNRKEEQAFIAEGPKLVGDLLGHFTCRLIVGTDEWLNQHPYIQASEIIVVREMNYLVSACRKPLRKYWLSSNNRHIK